jgi:hypothetical protein
VVLFRELMGIMWDIYIVTKDMNFKGTSNNGAVRGIHLTRTPGDDPRSNGRAETAVKSIKTQLRRILLQAGAEAKWWPWATCFVNELNRAARLVATGLIGFSSWLM